MTGIPIVETKGVCHYAYLDSVELLPFIPKGEPFKINSYTCVVRLTYSRYDVNKIFIDKFTKDVELSSSEAPKTVQEYSGLFVAYMATLEQVVSADKQTLSGYTPAE